MATIITEECINCGACEPECPNTAIYQGGVEYEWQGKKHPALAADFFYIVPEKCTECVGFFDHEACAAVCPVDCCVPDPNRPEPEALLLERARAIHPDKEFGADFPSRFRKQSDQPKAPTPVAAATPSQATAAPQPAAPVAALATSAPTLAQPVQAFATGRVERPVAKPSKLLQAGDPARDFDGELTIAFDDAVKRIHHPRRGGGSTAVGLALLVGSPLLGALSHGTKLKIEQAYGDPRFFSSQVSTGLNVALDFFLYPSLFFALGLIEGMQAFTEADKSWIVLGVLLATAETLVRLRDGIFHAKPTGQIRYGASIYGAPLGMAFAPLVAGFLRGRRSGWIPVEGFYSREFEPKREREKRYGEVYIVEELEGGYHVRMELPRQIPPSAARDELGLGTEMPDYDLRVSLNDGTLTVRGAVVDANLRAVCGVSPAFPADFKTEIPLAGKLAGFRHRYAEKLLEIVVLKREA